MHKFLLLLAFIMCTCLLALLLFITWFFSPTRVYPADNLCLFFMDHVLFTNIHLSYIHLMCVYFRFLWDAMCFLSSLMPYHPAHLRPWATTVFWTSSQSCSTNNMATLSMTVEVAGFQHGDGAIELSMYNVKYYI